MPLHLIVQCCKCNQSISHDLWSIARNHKYADSKYVCDHFSVTIDHESSCGIFGIGWRNEVKVSAYCKINYMTRTLINKTFNKSFMEYEDYARFGQIVCHARISDYRGNYPRCGFNIQNEIEYNERMERQRREEMERRRKEERDMQLQLENMIERGREEELQRDNELTIVKEKTKKKKKFKSHIKLVELDIDKIFENMYDIQIEKS